MWTERELRASLGERQGCGVAGRSREATGAFRSQYAVGFQDTLYGSKTILREHVTQSPVCKDCGWGILAFTLISVMASRALP